MLMWMTGKLVVVRDLNVRFEMISRDRLLYLIYTWIVLEIPVFLLVVAWQKMKVVFQIVWSTQNSTAHFCDSLFTSCVLTSYFLFHCYQYFCGTLPVRLREALQKEKHDLKLQVYRILDKLMGARWRSGLWQLLLGWDILCSGQTIPQYQLRPKGGRWLKVLECDCR